jgi:hypothetical protein
VHLIYRLSWCNRHCFLQPCGFVARPSVKFQSMALRTTLLLRSLIGAVMLLSAALRAGDTQFKKTPFGTGAEVGFGLVKYHNTCVWFRVFFISGDFFKGLQTHKTHNAIEFRKKKEKTMYANFPDQLLVDVEAHPLKCTAEMTPPDYAAGLMEGPSFELAWKRGDETRQVALFATQEHHHPLGFGWSYVFTVPSATVPLTDSLLIDVSVRHGLCRTHLTANLDSRLRLLVPVSCDLNE